MEFPDGIDKDDPRVQTAFNEGLEINEWIKGEVPE